MQREQFYFGVHVLGPSIHPEVDTTHHLVGFVEVVYPGGDDDLEIEIKSLYMRTECSGNDNPVRYMKIDEENKEFQKSDAYSEVIADICQRFGTVEPDNEDARKIVEYWERPKTQFSTPVNAVNPTVNITIIDPVNPETIYDQI